MRAGSLAVAMACMGCAAIHSTESTTNTRLEALVDHRVVDGSVKFSAVTEVHGHQLSVAIEQQETCETLTTSLTHRRRYVDRRIDPTLSRATWTVAALSIGGGVYGSLNSETLAAQSTAPDSPTAEQYQQYAGGLLIVGVVAATIGVIDGIRASDSKYDDGVLKGETVREESACHRRATRNHDVTLRLENGHEVAGRSDEGGKIAFDLSSIPEEGLPGEATHVSIGTAQLRLELSEAQRATIRASLLADPSSRLAMDVLQKQRDACARSVDGARSMTAGTDVSRDDLATWQSARTKCGSVWTASYEAELENVGERVVETECRNGLRAADEVFANGSEVTVEEMSAALGLLRERCKAPEQIVKVGKLEARLAGVVKRLEREAPAEARRVAREEAAELQRAIVRARAQRSVPAPSWPAAETRSCCKICSRGKACGNTCIARSRTCHVGGGCACDG